MEWCCLGYVCGLDDRQDGGWIPSSADHKPVGEISYISIYHQAKHGTWNGMNMTPDFVKHFLVICQFLFLNPLLSQHKLNHGGERGLE